MNAPDLVLDAVLRELNDFTSHVSLYLLPTAAGSGSFVLPVQSGGLHVDPEQLDALRGRLTRGRLGRAIVTADQTLIRTVLPEPAASPNLVLVPILIADTVVGSLNVGAEEQPTPHLIDDLRERADRIGAALTPVPDRSAHRRDLQLNLINRLGRQDVWQMELDAFLDLSVVSIREGLDYYNVSIFMLDEDRTALCLASHAGAYRGRVTRGYRQDIGDGLLGWVVRNRRMRLANDVSKETDFVTLEGLKTASEICLPIVIDNQVEGVLNVESDAIRAFDDGDVVALEALAQQIADVIQLQRKNEAFESLRTETEHRHRFGDLFGRSMEMIRIIEMIQTVAGSDLPVLVRGETGTGKELVARALHRESGRSGEAFVAVNCAALPESLFEDELFGHEKGAFTGADRQRLGKIELATGGTLFLDEVGEIPYPMQAKLLRAIAEKKITRVGGEREIDVDVRIISATNRPQEELESDRTFRQDLYFRLNAVQIEIPPLRERVDDIPLLAVHFLQQDSDRYRKDVNTIDPAVMARLLSYPWPGNVRELENVIGRAVLMSSGRSLTSVELRDSPPEDEEARVGLPEGSEHMHLDDVCRQVLGNVEQAYLRDLLIRTRGNVSEAARKAGVTRRTFYNKLTTYGMKRDDFIASS